MTPLSQIAAEVSSKNAGNFFLTFDVVFDTADAYERTKRAGVLTPERIAELYGLPVEDVIHIVPFEQGLAFKIVVRRPHSSGSIGESDVFGAQQYAPLLDLEVP
jgi:hypothetical protein